MLANRIVTCMEGVTPPGLYCPKYAGYAFDTLRPATVRELEEIRTAVESAAA